MLAIIYHKKDNDGKLGAYILSKIYATELSKGIAKLIPYDYEPKSEFMDEEFDSWAFTDCTPPMDWLKTLGNKTERVMIIDHHKDKDNQITETYPKLPLISSNNSDYSGCKLTYDWFKIELSKIFDRNKLIKLGDLVDSVSSYDTYEFSKGHSPEYKDKVNSINLYFNQFDKLDEFISSIDAYLISDQKYFDTVGTKLLNKLKSDNSDLLRKVEITEDNKLVIFSELKHSNYYLQQLVYLTYPDCEYILNYQTENGKYKYSIKSDRHNDCFRIAKKLGGGGHPNAAGFSVDHKLSNKELLALIE